MKGVILTAGGATRLKPVTNFYGKVLTPIYNKPMIYYGISQLVKCGITDIALVVNKLDYKNYKLLAKKYKPYGLNIKLYVQKQALGTAHALKYANNFIKNSNFVMLFGDNIFIQNNFDKCLTDAIKNNVGITLFAKQVSDPERFGIIEHDNNYTITRIEEKPKQPKSNLASTGLYICDSNTYNNLQNVKLSTLGEYVFTDVITNYVNNSTAKVKVLDDDCKWLDTGTFDSLLECSEIVKEFEAQNGVIGCIELELYKSGKISKTQFDELMNNYASDYKTRVYNSINK